MTSIAISKIKYFIFLFLTIPFFLHSCTCNKPLDNKNPQIKKESIKPVFSLYLQEGLDPQHLYTNQLIPLVLQKTELSQKTAIDVYTIEALDLQGGTLLLANDASTQMTVGQTLTFTNGKLSLLFKPGSSGKALLHIALADENKQYSAVKLVIDLKESITNLDELIKSAKEQGCDFLAKKLQAIKNQESNINIDEPNPTNHKNTALHDVADLIEGESSLEMAKVLLRAGANLHATNDQQDTPLHLAIKENDLELVKLLITYIPDVNKQNSAGKTPLHIAAEKGYTSIAILLAENKADYNKQDNQGNTPPHLAAQRGNMDTIYELLVCSEQHAAIQINTDLQNNEGNTLLHIAAWKGEVPLVRDLLNRGANPNLQNKNLQKTALHYALEGGYQEIARLLVEKGAKTDIPDAEWKKTAMELAKDKNYQELLTLFNNKK